MDAKLKERFFLASQESPGSWLLHALGLRAAAKRLDWRALPPSNDEATVSFMPEYLMLLGLAFENLLKGIISLARLEAGHAPPLPKECLVHSLEDLAKRPECTSVGFSAEELQVLRNLTPYIEWAGRYPIPKKVAQMMPLVSSNHAYDAEIRLWERLVPLLHERAWVMKGGPAHMGGNRLRMKGRAKPDA